ncbi:hypothetical protein B0H14DRAFT_2829415 [Mycena olivaceomarginata]|nr:hypothetical protein B0H14DRAFT_2829415 [Mycena olivaceomarginata]
MQLLVALAIVLPCELLPTLRRLADKRLLLGMAPYMPLQIKAPCKRDPAVRHRAHKRRLLLALVVRRLVRVQRRDVLLRNADGRRVRVGKYVGEGGGRVGGAERGVGVGQVGVVRRQ